MSRRNETWPTSPRKHSSPRHILNNVNTDKATQSLAANSRPWSMAADKHLPVQQCYSLAPPRSMTAAAITLRWDPTAGRPNFCGFPLLRLHCDFWDKLSSASEATCFWPAQPDNLHIRASLAFIRHELPPTQQMFRWGVLSSNLCYVDLFDIRRLRRARRLQHLSAASSHCLNLLLTLCQTAETQTCVLVAWYPGAHMEMLESVHNQADIVIMF